MSVSRAIRSAAVWRGLISILAAIAVLTWPELLAEFIVSVVGFGLLAIGLVELIGAITTPRDAASLARSLVLIVGGVFVLFAPSEPVDLVKVGIAVIIGLRAVMGMITAFRAWRRNRSDPFWPTVSGLLSLGLAVALLAIPRFVVSLVVLVVAASWIVSGLVVLVNALGDDDQVPAPTDLAGVLRERTMAPDVRSSVTAAIFEGSDSRAGTIRFVALMAFATTIATFGVEADSTAVVIGAMLIAPLMGPIMALSAGILMGWFDRAVSSLRRVGFGVSIAIFTSFVMSIFSPELVSITANSQVLGRTSPTLLDLLIALAAGGAGAYALSHPAVSNSLPGVAIAVALVPPLAVVGISLQSGEFSFAAGAMLLFLTNLVGIVAAAGVVFVLSGYSPWSEVEKTGDTGRRSFALIALALLLVAIPLALIGNEIIEEATLQATAEEIVDQWLSTSAGAEIVSVDVNGDEVAVVVVGTTDQLEVQTLADELSDGFGAPVNLSLTVVPQTTFEVESA